MSAFLGVHTDFCFEKRLDEGSFRGIARQFTAGTKRVKIWLFY